MNEMIVNQAKALMLQQKVDVLERAFLELPQEPCPVIHRFGPGVYIREVTIPANTIAIGHHQNFEHMNVFLKGRVTILNEDGSTRELKAPMIFTGQPGRKVGYIHEDVVWLNIYATDEQDVEKLEGTYLTKSEGFDARLVEKLSRQMDVDDFQKAIDELGVTAEQVRLQSENELDQCALPSGGYKIKVAKSEIEGQGLFATADIEPGEVIAPARVSGKRTIAGRYTNHSMKPNAKMVAMAKGDIYLTAISHISGCHGGLDGEEITIDYRNTFKVHLKSEELLCQV